MRRKHRFAGLLSAFALTASVVFGDGGFFFEEGEAADLAQTRQEVLSVPVVRN